jgi:hypothetical protein
MQAVDFLFWTGDGSGRLGCYVGDGLLVFPSAVRGDGGSLFKCGDGDGRGNAAAFSGAAMATVCAAVSVAMAAAVSGAAMATVMAMAAGFSGAAMGTVRAAVACSAMRRQYLSLWRVCAAVNDAAVSMAPAVRAAMACSALRPHYLSLWRTLSVPSRMCKSRRSRSSGCCSNACFISNSCLTSSTAPSYDLPDRVFELGISVSSSSCASFPVGL